MNFAERLDAHEQALARHLRALRPLSVLTDVPGNVGDRLIGAGLDALMERQLLAAERVPLADLSRRSGRTLVVPGSGAWSVRWHEWLPAAVADAAARFERVLVTASSFDEAVPDVRATLGLPNVFVVCRDAHSYRWVRRHGRASLGMDPALSHPRFDPSLVPASGSGPVLISLRTDVGSPLRAPGLRPSPDNRDLSVDAVDADDFIDAVRAASSVVTDRLHVVVAAVMTGTPVRYLDPYDQKISLYLTTTFHDEASHLAVRTTLSELIADGVVMAA